MSTTDRHPTDALATAYRSIRYRGPELQISDISPFRRRSSHWQWALPAGMAAALALWLAIPDASWDPDPGRVHFSAVRTTVAFRVPSRPADNRWRTGPEALKAPAAPQPQTTNPWQSEPSRG